MPFLPPTAESCGVAVQLWFGEAFREGSKGGFQRAQELGIHLGELNFQDQIPPPKLAVCIGGLVERS